MSAPPRARKRTISTTLAAKQATAAAGQQRDTFAREYFWPNSILREVLGTREKSSGTRVVSQNGRQKEAPFATKTLQSSSLHTSTETNTISTATEELVKEELPHRRRKRLRAEAEAAAQNSEPTSTADIPHDASSRLSTAASSLPTTSLRRLLTTYLSLSKPRLTFLIVLTATAAYTLYPVPALLSPTTTAAPSLSTLTLLYLTSGTFLASSSANALNMLLEPSHDAKMSRTRNRPLVRGLISPRGALLFALATGITGVAALYVGVNPTTAALGAFNIFLYAGVYTPLKRLHVANTWVGAVVGGIPPLMGWTAAAGQCAQAGADGWRDLLFGQGAAGGWLLAALLFAWQFPHFNALSWTIREEYKRAGYKMLAWTNPARNARVAVRYSVVMFPVCYGLWYVGVVGPAFLPLSTGVNAWMAWEAARFWRDGGGKGSARRLFWASVWHLPVLLVGAMVLKTGLWERVWRGVRGEVEGLEGDDEGWEEEEEEEDEDGVGGVS